MTRERLEKISDTIVASNQHMRDSLQSNGFDNKIFELPKLIDAMDVALTEKTHEVQTLTEEKELLQEQRDSLQAELDKITEKGIAEYVKLLANLG